VKRRRREGRSAGSRPALLAGLIERAGRRRAQRLDEQPPEEPPAPAPRRVPAGAAQRVPEPPARAERPAPIPREWNLWDLERLARAQGADIPRAEEWSALFVHLRAFANADGVLPKEFDRLVRESFGQLIEAA
jgi:hypothetical protein